MQVRDGQCVVNSKIFFVVNLRTLEKANIVVSEIEVHYRTVTRGTSVNKQVGSAPPPIAMCDILLCKRYRPATSGYNFL